MPSAVPKPHARSARIIVVLFLLLTAAGIGIYELARAPGKGYYAPRPVHWHAALTMSVCGSARTLKERDFDRPLGPAAGTALLHTHGDDIIHIEGRIPSKDDITLGAFFSELGIAFAPDRFMDKQGQGACHDGNADTLHVSVNGTDVNDPAHYVVQDRDKIEIRFE